jgi:predicted dehydrogenase
VRVYNSRAQAFQILARCPQVTPIVDVLTYWIDMVCWFMQENRVVEVYARGNGEIFRAAGHDMDDLAWAILTFADGAWSRQASPTRCPSTIPRWARARGWSWSERMACSTFEDEHKNHFLYSEQGALHGYVPNHAVKAAFLASSSYGDWAQGNILGPLADETRAFVEFIRTGNRGTLCLPKKPAHAGDHACDQKSRHARAAA